MTAYLYLGLAIASELFATSRMKSTEGFTLLVPTVVCLTGYAVSLVCLARALHAGMPVGTGYAIWSGLGTALIVAIGVAFLGESISPVKVVGIALVIVGVVVLNLGGAH